MNTNEGAMAPIYLNDWKVGGWLQMVADFEGIFITPAEFAATTAPYANEAYWLKNKAAMQAALCKEQWQGVDVLLASYSAANYSGDAFVLFKRDDRLYEVNGSHCSCYGLEDQWSPEETSLAAMQHRLDAGSLGDDSYSDNVFADDLRALIAALAEPRP